MRLSSALIIAALVTACGGAPSVHYDPTVVVHDATPAADPAALAAAVQTSLDGRALRVGKPGALRRVKDFTRVPPAVLQAVFVTQDARFEGAELDIIANLPGGARVPVTVIRQPEGPVDAQTGSSKTLKWPAAPADLPGRFGIGPLEGRQGRTWTARDRVALAQALSALSPGERVAIAGLPFVRDGRGVTADRGAQYDQEDCQARIVVFDRAFAGRRYAFVGPVEKPLPIGVFSLIHEFGHALHHLPGRRAQCGLIDRINVRNAAGKALNAKVRRFNAAVPKANRGDAKARAQVERLAPQIEKEQARLKRLDAELARAEKRIGRLVRRGPVLDAWAKAVGDGAPTPYGRESMAEAFAESFALFHADPEALRRVLPKAHAFFAAGKHIAALGKGGSS